jgi:hypothetical protein
MEGAITWSVAIQTKPVEITSTMDPMILNLRPEIVGIDFKRVCVFIREFSSLQTLILMLIV